MPVLRHLRVHVEVVEQDELAGERAVVGRGRVPEQGQRRVPVALRQAAQDLVVRSVLLDHVDDVLDPMEPRRLGPVPGVDAVVGAHLRRPASERVEEPPSRLRDVDDLHRALDHRPDVLVLGKRGVVPRARVVVGLVVRALDRAERRERSARIRLRSRPVGVDHDQPPSVRRHLHVGRVPGRRDEPEHLPAVGVDDHDGVLARVRDEQEPAVGAHREANRRRSLGSAGVQPDRDGRRERVGAGVDHGDGVAAGVRHVQLVAHRVGRDAGRMVGEQRVLPRARAGCRRSSAASSCR